VDGDDGLEQQDNAGSSAITVLPPSHAAGHALPRRSTKVCYESSGRPRAAEREKANARASDAKPA